MCNYMIVRVLYNTYYELPSLYIYKSGTVQAYAFPLDRLGNYRSFYLLLK